ncbi:DUF2059 domain-containing protein [Geopsychrobacter electrodiphilus]|uniref:DUF2059 domain-containing protein n=1 Tax=Geopsychrobacter electrodiphilus TaxID=225196 RepID=UPI000371AA7E|nr:DUF2059 domain-containing protein [Geopsychrobacter electrodiphilus]
MKKLVMFALIVLISLPVVARAGDTERRQLAEQFLTLNKVKEQVDMMYGKVEGIIVSQIEAIDIPENREKNLLEMQKIARNLLFKGLSWDSLKEEYTKLYTDTFTEKELQGLIEFSKSPLGQKMAEKSPILMQKSMEIGRQHAQQVMPKVQQAIQDYMKENVKTVKTPSETSEKKPAAGKTAD